MVDERLVLLGKIVHTTDVFPGNNEQMDWRLRPDVFDHREGLILIDKVRLFFSPQDLTEEAVFFHGNGSPASKVGMA